MPIPERACPSRDRGRAPPTPPHPKPTSPGHSWKWGWDLGTPERSRSCGGGSVTPHTPLLLQARPAGFQGQGRAPSPAAFRPLPAPGGLSWVCVHPARSEPERPFHPHVPRGGRALSQLLASLLSIVQKCFSLPKKSIIPNIPQD